MTHTDSGKKKEFMKNRAELYTEELLNKYAYTIETRLKFLIKPKPRYLPSGVWKWLVKRLVYVEVADNGYE